MFAIGIDFITGLAVMTDAASREKAEWPPHPARVFMAMVAAHYETKPLSEDGQLAEQAWTLERKALEWLENQSAPEMSWPEASPRDVMKVYVPVNDASVPPNPLRVKDSELRTALCVLPELRSRQERTFPASHVGWEGPGKSIILLWPNSTPDETLRISLANLTRKVTHIGHSSSLALMWVADLDGELKPRYSPLPETSGRLRGLSLRIPAAGFLAELDQRFNADDIEAFFELSSTITGGDTKSKKAAKATFEEKFGVAWSRGALAPVRLRPAAGRTARYFRTDTTEAPVLTTTFDSELLVLTKQEGPVLGLESTAALTAALRGYLLQGGENKPEWFTGHSTPGVPSTSGHMALLPLAFVSGDHADGHILGLAIAFPRAVSTSERAACLRDRLFGTGGDDLDPRLVMGNLGTWTIRREERSLPPMALRSITWSEPSTVWASVTPIVLDRHPKHDQRTERTQWREEVIVSIAQSCVREGLPEPTVIDVDKTSWHRGAPRSKPGPNGMPLLPGKPGSPPRQQIHALIQFPCEVQGPLILGAGRFRGYGICKPLGAVSK